MRKKLHHATSVRLPSLMLNGASSCFPAAGIRRPGRPDAEMVIGDAMASLNADRRHTAVLVQVGPWQAEIDEEIAPLIREMWIAGIETSMSCQADGAGPIWIEFPDQTDLIRFLDITAVYEPGAETLYNRMNWLLPLSDPNLAWDYELFPGDASLVWSASDVHTPCGYENPPNFFFTFNVRFPMTDLAVVYRRLLEHNRQSASRLGNSDSTGSPRRCD